VDDLLLRLASSSAQLVHQSFTVDTRDREDHTFSGIMFDIEAKHGQGYEYLEVDTVFVRGYLGGMTVWITPDSHQEKYDDPDEWTRIFEQHVDASPFNLQPLVLDEPIRLRPGDAVGVYVHSTRRGDQAIVYDNQRSRVSSEDPLIRVLPGRAHLSAVCRSLP